MEVLSITVRTITEALETVVQIMVHLEAAFAVVVPSEETAEVVSEAVPAITAVL